MNNREKLAAKIRQKGFFTKIPISNDKDSEYIFLWRSVLDISLSDLIKGKNKYNTYFDPDSDRDKEWLELIVWFDPENHDFQTVCGCSGLNPQIVYLIMEYCIQNAETIQKKEKWNDIILHIFKTAEKASS